MTSFLLVITLLLILAYGAFSWHFIGHWRGVGILPRHPRREHLLLGVLLLLHAMAVMGPLREGALLSLGVGRALSVLVWLMLLIYWTCGFFYRVEGLQLFMMPLAVATLAFSLLFPGEHLLGDLSNPALLLHILVSMLAYSLLAIGALVALLMLALDKALHDKRWITLVRQLPPLLSLETMMFQVLGVGFLLLTASLFSGVVFSEEVFGKPAAWSHKIVFSIMAWGLFGALLVGRKLYGWRGKLAVRWTLIGFVALMFAYVGSKVVLELVLHRG
ncbi:cytochrome C assembly family protein [Pseudogulbenkiania ferrooxidans]|uniref:Cytochrome c assembly protein n=1 Tax=Pseudogulbenkiania ferrooxidans 2002 TaxID=279714 RepID=B9YZB6_9NEIS|nr:cytochrome c biogenesis protein CcsA [Pseudogulbenkiania ferrooxidans]EEG10469.1 cytochrome c assembly protein [Pseudogulbenkiania ferrooxidans 2002]